jgi:hypothetical protein
MLQKVFVRYLDESALSEWVAIHPGDDMRATRAIDKEPDSVKNDPSGGAQLSYRAFFACRRLGHVPPDTNFDAWNDTVADLEPLITDDNVEAALGAGLIDERQADFMRATKAQQEARMATGESPAPRS